MSSKIPLSRPIAWATVPIITSVIGGSLEPKNPTTPLRDAIQIQEATELLFPKALGKERTVPVYRGPESLSGIKFSSSPPFVEKFIMMGDREFDQSIPNQKARLEGVMAHELIHVKENHSPISTGIFGACLFATSAVASAIIGPGKTVPRKIAKSIARGTTTVIAGTVASKKISPPIDKIMEKRADLKGFEISSDSAKTARIENFEHFQKTNIEAKKQLKELLEITKELNKIEGNNLLADGIDRLEKTSENITETGDIKSDVRHPPISERIQYLKKALAEDNKKAAGASK